MTLVALNRIFKAKYGGAFSKMPDYSVGNTPVIKSQGTNNGVIGYLDIKPNFHNIITIARTGSVGATFFHPYPCYATDDCIVLEAKIKLTERQMLFYAYLIRKESKRYNYSRKVTPNRLNSTLIFSPGDIPNWVNNTPNLDMPLNSSITEADISINQRTWKEFKLNSLFEITRGKRHVQDNRIEGDILYFSASEYNNGCTDRISNPLFVEKNSIIYSTFGDVYYVDGIFTASDEVNIFKHERLNKYTGLFVATIMKQNKYKYSFGRKAFKNKFTKDRIQLPVDLQDNPDWQFMEDYIKSLPYSSNLKSD